MYSGSWKHGKKNGEGVFTFSNGNVYSGSWKDDEPNGEGVTKSPNGEVI